MSLGDPFEDEKHAQEGVDPADLFDRCEECGKVVQNLDSHVASVHQRETTQEEASDDAE